MISACGYGLFQYGLWFGTLPHSEGLMVDGHGGRYQSGIRTPQSVGDVEALHRREPDAPVTELQLAHVLALSYRRLQPWRKLGGRSSQRIRSFCTCTRRSAKHAWRSKTRSGVTTQPGASAACVGVSAAPAWKLLYERQGSYNPDSHTNRVIYGDQEEGPAMALRR